MVNRARFLALCPLFAFFSVFAAAESATTTARITLKNEVSLAPTQVAALSNQAATTTTQVASLQTQLAAVTTQVAALQNEVVPAPAQVAAVSNQAVPAPTQVAALQNTATPTTTQLAAVTTKVAPLPPQTASAKSAPSLIGDTSAIPTPTQKLLSQNVFPVAVKRLTDTKIVYEDGTTFPEPAPNEFVLIGTAFLRDDGYFYSCCEVFNLITQSSYSDYYVIIDGDAYKVGAVHKFSLSRNFIVFSLVNYPVSAAKSKQKNEQSVQEKVLAVKTGLTFDTLSSFTDSLKNLSENAVHNAASTEEATNANGHPELYALFASSAKEITSKSCAVTKTEWESINSEWQWGKVSEQSLSKSKKMRGAPVVTQNGLVIGMLVGAGKVLFIDECEAIEENTGDICHPFTYNLPNMAHKSFNRLYIDEVELPLTLNALRTRVFTNFNRHLETFALSVRKVFGVTGEHGFLQSTGSKDIIASGFVSDFPLMLSTAGDGSWAYFAPDTIEKDLLEDKGTTLFGSLFGYSLALISKPKTVTLEKLASSPRLYMDYLLYAFPLSRPDANGNEVFVRSLGMPYKSERYTDAQKRIWYVNYWHVHYCNREIITYALPLPEGLFIMMKNEQEGTTESQTRLSMRFMADCVYARYSANLTQWKEYYAFLRRTNALYPPFNTLLFDYSPKLFKVKSTWFDLELSPNDFSYTDESTMRIAMGYSHANGRLISEVRSVELFTDYKASDYRYIFFAKSPRPLEGASNEAIAEWSEKQSGAFPFCAEPYNHESFTYYDEVFYPTTKAARKDAKTLYLFSCELRGANRFDAIKDFAFTMKSSFRLIE